MNQRSANRWTVATAIIGLLFAGISLIIAFDARKLAFAQFRYELEESIPKPEFHPVVMRSDKENALTITIINKGSPMTVLDAGFRLPVGDAYPPTTAVYNVYRLTSLKEILPTRLEKYDAWVCIISYDSYIDLRKELRDSIDGFAVSTTAGMFFVENDIWEAFVKAP